MKDNISFKEYQILLNNLPYDCQLMQVVNLRNTPDYEIKDMNMLKAKRSVELRNENVDSIKIFFNKVSNGKESK